MAEPPFDPGAVKFTTALPFAGDTVPIVGAPGTVDGVTDTVPDGSLLPTELTATTLQLYVVPFDSPVTLIGLAEPDAVTVAAFCAEQVTTYDVIGCVPVLVGAVNEISALALPAVAVPIVGASGTVSTGSGGPSKHLSASRTGTSNSVSAARRRI